MTKHSSDAPVVSIICLFRFSLSEQNPWTDKKPAELLNLLKSDYPNFRPEQELGLDIQVGEGNVISHKALPTKQKFVFSCENNNRVITVAQDSFSFTYNVSVGHQYKNWKESFRPLLEKSWNQVRECLSVKRAQSIGLRYINHIELSNPVSPGSVLNKNSPYIPAIITSESLNFFNRTEIALDNKSTIIVNTGTAYKSATDKTKIVILDIDKIIKDEFDCDNVLLCLDKSQEDVEDIFFLSIPDSLKKKLK